jgi:hypothetical protein
LGSATHSLIDGLGGNRGAAFEEVMRDLRRRRGGGREGARCLAMDRLPAGPGKLVIQRLTVKRVREAEPIAAHGDQAAPGEVVERVDLVLNHLGEDAVGHLDTEDGGGLEHRSCFIGHQSEALADDFAHAERNGKLLADATGAHLANHLVDEQRVALRYVENRGRDLLIGSRYRLPNQDGDIGGGEARELEYVARPADARQDIARFWPGPCFEVAVGPDDEGGEGAQGSREKLEQQERRVISSVEILENDKDRLARGLPADRRRNLAEEGETSCLRVTGGDCRRVREGDSTTLQGLAPRPEDGRAASFPASPPGNADAGLPRDVRGLR